MDLEKQYGECGTEIVLAFAKQPKALAKVLKEKMNKEEQKRFLASLDKLLKEPEGI